MPENPPPDIPDLTETQLLRMRTLHEFGHLGGYPIRYLNRLDKALIDAGLAEQPRSDLVRLTDAGRERMEGV